jgi:hypothetical protein
MNNFNLSNKIEDASYIHFKKDMISVEDIKEFIKRLKQILINYEIANSKELLVIYLELNQLLGEKLI